MQIELQGHKPTAYSLVIELLLTLKEKPHQSQIIGAFVGKAKLVLEGGVFQ